MSAFRLLHSLVLPFLASSWVVLPGSAQAPSSASETPMQVVEESPKGNEGLRKAIRRALEIEKSLTPSIRVNGVLLDPEEIDRQTIYLIGQRQMRQKLVELLVDDQMDQLIKEGKRKPEDFKILEKEVQAFIAKQVKEYKEKNPDKDFWEQLRRSNTSKEEFLSMNRSTLLFDKVFFPGIPSKWPDLTKEAIIAAGGAQGEAFYNRFADNVKEGQEVPGLLLAICRQWVMQQLQKWSDVRYASDGLPPSIIMQVNGRVWRTKDAIKALSLRITKEDRERALVEIALNEALKAELKKKGKWLTEEEFAKAYEEFRKPYEGSPFTVEVVALNFKGFPSLEAYKQRWRLETAFSRMIAAEVNDDNLAKHAERAKSFLGDGRVSVDFIRLPAMSNATGKWIPGGFEKAMSLGRRIMDDLAAGKLGFEEAMKRYSEWPPEQKHQGRLSSKSFNELRGELRETDYTDFVHGFSIGAIFFYDIEVGSIAGPFRGQDGVYIGRVNSRQPPTGTVSIDDKNMRDLVKQDYLSTRFLKWANEVASRIEIR